MTRIPEERLARYRALAARSLFEVSDPAARALFERAAAEGVDLVSNRFNTLGMFRAPHRRELEGVDLVIAGIPLDLGVPNPRPGTRKGPEAVRYWSLDRNILHHRTGVSPYELCSVIDWGDVDVERCGYSLERALEAVFAVYRDFAEHDLVTLTIGGEHTCTFPVLRALSREGERPLALIHLDAHLDTASSFGGCRVSDASLFQVAACEGYIDPERTIQIGIRGRGVVRADFSRESGMRVLWVEEVQARGIEAVLAEIREVVGEAPVYLTIDTDCFDCAVMPGTTLPEPFGLSGVEVRDLIRGVRGLDVVGADLMELNPAYDPSGASACLAAAIAFELLCLLAEARARRSGTTRPTRWRGASAPE